MSPVLLTVDASSISGLLSLAGEMVTWFITQMGAYLKFVTDNPIVLIFLLLTLAGAGIGYLTRLMKSVG